MRLAGIVLDLIFPPKCVFCHRILESGSGPVCGECRRTVPVRNGRDGMTYAGKEVDECYAPLDYSGYVKDSLHRFKFGGNSFYSDVYADIICGAFGDGELQCDVVSWVPLSGKRLRQRGYDQARLIAEGISQRTGIPCVRTLVRHRNAKPQSLTGNYESRVENIRDAYIVSPDADIKGKSVLLVDDIVTTGATLCEAARTLKGSGASYVKAAAAASAGRISSQVNYKEICNDSI